ncbi:MAG TPA: DedA family protein [Longimicrobium sp.]|nr:DedA family protein [Longimicrobium sp.]
MEVLQPVIEFLRTLIDFILHVDEHLTTIIRDYGGWTYAILFLIIFVETGVVIMPLLPGDSLLFATGALAARGDMQVLVLFVLLCVAAIAGDSLNYWIGSKVGEKAFDGRFRFLKREHLERTHHFFDKYGGKTIVLARFIPIVRTYAPFVAGASKMDYARFLTFNVVGGVLWITIFLWAGYFFGNIPTVKENFEYVVIIIILLSLAPALYEWYRHRREKRRLEAANESL